MIEEIYENFKRSEFACKCGCGFDAVDAELLERLISIRIFYDLPVIINSGCRCASHNKAVGGKPDSQHLIAKAVDIKINGLTGIKIAKRLNQRFPYKYGIGLYNNIPELVHFDVRPYRARWGGIW